MTWDGQPPPEKKAKSLKLKKKDTEHHFAETDGDSRFLTHTHTRKREKKLAVNIQRKRYVALSLPFSDPPQEPLMGGASTSEQDVSHEGVSGATEVCSRLSPILSHS